MGNYRHVSGIFFSLPIIKIYFSKVSGIFAINSYVIINFGGGIARMLVNYPNFIVDFARFLVKSVGFCAPNTDWQAS